MGRPPLAVGSFGSILARRDGDRWKARVYIRDADGRRREIARWAPTKASAESAVKAAIQQRPAVVAGATGDLSAESRVRELAARWLDEVEASDRAVNTRALYRSTVEGVVLPALGALQLRESTVPRVDAALQAIRATNGPGRARTARTALRQMFGLAVRHGAIATNPVTDTSKITSNGRKRPRALTRDEEDQVRDVPRSSQRALDLDLPDLIDWMLGTGMRIGEACAIRDSVLDLEAGTVEVNATVIRPKGRGLVIQERPKSAAGWRVLALPDDLVIMLKRRRGELRIEGPDTLPMLDDAGEIRQQADRLAFPSPAGKLRDPSNTQDDLREVLDSIGCDQCERTGFLLDEDGEFIRDKNRQRIHCSAGPLSWATSHTFRKTAATRLREAGLPAHVVADVLGHSQPSMTQDVYFGRSVVSVDAARLLARPS